MKRHLTGVLATMMVLGAALAAVAQQENAARERWQRWREAQNKAIQAVLADAVKLRAAFEEAGRTMPGPAQWESMSDEERNKFRETAKARWEEKQKVIADLEQQIAVLKGPRQLRFEQDQAVQELTVIRDLAKQEKAKKTAERLQELIDRRQTEFDQIVQKIGVQP